MTINIRNEKSARLLVDRIGATKSVAAEQLDACVSRVLSADYKSPADLANRLYAETGGALGFQEAQSIAIELTAETHEPSPEEACRPAAFIDSSGQRIPFDRYFHEKSQGRWAP